MTEKNKLLFIMANPIDAKFSARLDKEMREVANKICAGRKGDSFEIAYEFAVTPGSLQKALLEHEPDILHFSGHGAKGKGLMLEDASGRKVILDKRAFTRLLKVMGDKIRMVVLNACYTNEQGLALKEIVDYTIGMKSPVLDESAIIFSAYFYQALAYGKSVEDAFELGLTQLDIERMPSSRIPKLLVRDGVDSSKQFLRQGKSQKNKKPGMKNQKDARSSAQRVNKGVIKIAENSTLTISGRAKVVAQDSSRSNTQD